MKRYVRSSINAASNEKLKDKREAVRKDRAAALKGKSNNRRPRDRTNTRETKIVSTVRAVKVARPGKAIKRVNLLLKAVMLPRLVSPDKVGREARDKVDRVVNELRARVAVSKVQAV